MTGRARSSILLLLIAGGPILLASWYGRSRRLFVVPPRVIAAGTSAEVLQAWRAAGVAGRVAVVFSRRLNGEQVGTDGGPELPYVEVGLERGPLRVVHHYVPDAAWSEVSGNLARMAGVRPIEEGFALPFGGGRVHVRPLSRLRALEETALVVVSPTDWSAGERGRIADALRTGLLSTDLLAVLRGSAEDVALLAAVVPAGPAGAP